MRNVVNTKGADFKARYGHEDISFSEFMSLPEYQRKTRNNKEIMIDELERMELLCQYLKEYVRNIPELDDKRHSEAVETFKNRIESAKTRLDNSYRN